MSALDVTTCRRCEGRLYEGGAIEDLGKAPLDLLGLDRDALFCAALDWQFAAQGLARILARLCLWCEQDLVGQLAGLSLVRR